MFYGLSPWSGFYGLNNFIADSGFEVPVYAKLFRWYTRPIFIKQLTKHFEKIREDDKIIDIDTIHKLPFYLVWDINFARGVKMESSTYR